MAFKQLNLVMILGLISRALSLSCPECVKSNCNTPSDCIAGITTNACHCCDICARSVYEECGGPFSTSGTCGDGLTCRKALDDLEQSFDQGDGICVEGVCADTWSRPGCVTDSEINRFSDLGFSRMCNCPNIKFEGHCETPYGKQICKKTCGHHCGSKRSWTPATNACIRDYNNLILDHDLSFEDCKSRCQGQFDFMCRSIEYNAQWRRCVLSGGDSSHFSYMRRCYLEGWTYTELI